MSLAYYFPIFLIVASNVIYNLSAKCMPHSADPMASLTVTYAVGAAASAVLYCVFNRNGNFFRECSNINWTAFALGICIVGLEAGSILMYRAGWNINTGYVVHSSILAVLLLLIGAFFFREAITMKKAIGIALSLSGVILMAF